MTKMLLAAAGSIAIVLSAGAGQAQSHHGSRHDGPVGSFVNPGFAGCGAVGGQRSGRGDHRGDDRGDRRDDRRGASNFCSTGVVMDWYGGEWAKWNNRTWEPTSYNDWWHEEPARAYPAWMQRNQDCSRQWYSGDTLRC
jgi:hypothetical protein